MNICSSKNSFIRIAAALMLIGPLLASAAAAVSAYDRIVVSGFESTPTYYVATSGIDSNPGTRVLPWKTIKYAVGASSPAPAGSVIYFRQGWYIADRLQDAARRSAACARQCADQHGRY